MVPRIARAAFAVLAWGLGQEPETLLDQIDVVEVTAPDEGRGMVSPLAHGAGAGDPHGPEKDALRAFGTRHQGVGPEGTAAFSSAGGHRAQFVVIGEFVRQG